jgi:predicted O-methyltransferase YrrM
MKNILKSSLIAIFLVTTIVPEYLTAQSARVETELDKKVKQFLSEQSGQWHDMNVPTVDGKKLFDLVLEGNYKSALEIGTSTGYSGIYIAWALSKTGGKLITIEIDEDRYKIALRNFEKAELSDYVDARLADAHILVRELEGPFDFIFSDADKYWYKNYFDDINPKLKVGGCFATHNVIEGGHGGRRGWNQEYLDYIRSLDNYETTLFTAGGGLLISYKRGK